MSSSNENQSILCIPGVFVNIKEERIRRVFSDLDIGEVVRVDIIVLKKSTDTDVKENKFNRVFVHIKWNDSQQSIACRERLSQGKDVKVIYDEPWFWRVSVYRPPAPKPKFIPKPKKVVQPKKATIQFDYESEVKYSGIIAPGLTGIIAEGLNIAIPNEEKSIDEMIDELLEDVPKEEIQKQPDYGDVAPPPARRKRIIIDREAKK